MKSSAATPSLMQRVAAGSSEHFVQFVLEPGAGRGRPSHVLCLLLLPGEATLAVKACESGQQE